MLESVVLVGDTRVVYSNLAALIIKDRENDGLSHDVKDNEQQGRIHTRLAGFHKLLEFVVKYIIVL